MSDNYHEVPFICNNSYNPPEPFKAMVRHGATNDEYKEIIYQKTGRRPWYIKALSISNRWQVRYIGKMILL